MIRSVSTLVDPVETMGLEPTTLCLQSRCSSQLSYVPGAHRSYRPCRPSPPGCSAGAAEARPVGERVGADHPAEVLAQAGGGAEAGLPGDISIGQVGRLRAAAGPRDPLVQQPLQRRRAGRARNRRAKVRGAISARRARSSTLRSRSRWPSAHVEPRPGGPRRPSSATGASTYWAWPPSRCGRHDHPPGDGVGHLGAVVEADQVQAQVDARRRPGRREDAVRPT